MLDDESRLELPPVPPAQATRPVAAWREPLTIDTYLPEVADRYPAFLETRVYQGSSGRVYPLPFHERISPTKAPREWDAIHLENAWVRLVILPELGGRIHVGFDKTNGYDFFYRNNVIKPALVGLAGPWISGGVEFNWPQHHRPGTFLKTESFVEHEEDGSVTVWCSDHDPFARMKGMHGIRLRPDSSVIELRARLFNRTADVQTFLWWANVAARAGEHYQSFFPPDARAVADHAKRAVTAFPRADRTYYGVDYPARVDAAHPDADRIDWYRNIPVPTSYMCLATKDDFFGGYDHKAQAGFVHWADHRVAPGKKQWTWGNGPFGWAWDANLTDTDGPYVELMAGVFTDNQPDFAFLAPGETKVFSQYWFPIRGLGAVHQATLDVAARLDVEPNAAGGTSVRVAVGVTAQRAGLELHLLDPARTVVWHHIQDTGPGVPVVEQAALAGRFEGTDLTLVVTHLGQELLRWQHRTAPVDVEVPAPATEPKAPSSVTSVEELFLTGLHLEQYRHATRSPEPYWLEALERDPGDSRSNIALGARRFRAARYEAAEGHLRTAIERQTTLNPNPYDGEAHYRLGQVLARTGRHEDAYDAYAKSAWTSAWRGPAYLAMARIDAARGRDEVALTHALAALTRDGEQLQARNVSVVLLRRLGRGAEAATTLAETLAIDPLDCWARDLAGERPSPDAPTGLDIALEYVSVGEFDRALRLLTTVAGLATAPGQVEVAPLAHYHRADILSQRGDAQAADAALAAAGVACATRCLASRLDDVDMLQRVCAAHPSDARAWALLGHWFYFQRRYSDAIDAWQTSTTHDDRDPVVWRNLAVAAFNVRGDADLAETRYARALKLAPLDARLLYESDQLAKRTGKDPAARLQRLQAEAELVSRRDDLTVEVVELLTIAGRADDALDILRRRTFQPWEGGEGQVLGAWDEALLSLARSALDAGDPARAVDLLEIALEPPPALGEGRHLLANCSHLYLALGDARAASSDRAGALDAWRRAATSTGDSQAASTLACSELTYFSVIAYERLGDNTAAKELTDVLEHAVEDLRATPAEVDYFATSLPTMLLFTDDLEARKITTALVLEAQVAVLRGDAHRGAELVDDALRREPSRVRALDLRRELTGGLRSGVSR